MSIKVKAIEKNISFDKNTEKWAYVLQPEHYNRLSANKVIAEAATRSGLSKGAIAAAWTAIGDVITAWATEGHSVVVPSLDTMRFGPRSTGVASMGGVASVDAVASVASVGGDLVTSRRVIFTPDMEMKQQLATTAISITCYDRTDKLVKQGCAAHPRGTPRQTNPPSVNVTLMRFERRQHHFQKQSVNVTLMRFERRQHHFQKQSVNVTLMRFERFCRDEASPPALPPAVQPQGSKKT